ncbi:hypothetical protein V8G54_006088, partial [Vigna mungo]
MERNMPKQQRGLASRRNLERLKLELSTIKQGVQSYELVQGNNGTWGFLRYGIGEEHDQIEAYDGAEFNKAAMIFFYLNGVLVSEIAYSSCRSLLNHAGNCSVVNYTDEETVVDMKFPARGSKVEVVPDPLLTQFIPNVSAPKSSDIHGGEGFSSNVSDVSNVRGYDHFFFLYFVVET